MIFQPGVLDLCIESPKRIVFGRKIYPNKIEKAVIKATNKLSVEFNAVSFEEALNLLIEISKQQTVTLDEIKKEVLSSWKEIKKKPPENR